MVTIKKSHVLCTTVFAKTTLVPLLVGQREIRMGIEILLICPTLPVHQRLTILTTWRILKNDKGVLWANFVI